MRMREAGPEAAATGPPMLPDTVIRLAGLQQLARRCASLMQVDQLAIATIDTLGSLHLLPADGESLTEVHRAKFVAAVGTGERMTCACVTDPLPATIDDGVALVPFLAPGGRNALVFAVNGEPPSPRTLRLVQELCATAARELAQGGALPTDVSGGSERSAAEAAALHYLAALKATLEATTDAILVTGPTGAIVSHNRRFCQAWGLPAGTLPPDCQDDVWDAVGSALTDPGRVDAWLQTIDHDPLGAVHDQVELRAGAFIEVASQPHCAASGTMHRVWSFRDVTARITAERALRRSEEHFRSLIETSADIVFASDLAGTFLYISPSVERILGFRADELCGTSVFDLVHPDDRALAAASYLDENSVPGTGIELRLRILTRDGDWKMLHLLSQTRTDDRLKPVAVVTARDVTDLARAQAELQQTNQTLRATLDAMPLALIALDADSNVRIWNRAAERIFGWRTDEVLGRPNPTVPEQDRPAHRELVRASLAGHTVEGAAMTRQRRDGSSLDVTLWTAPVLTSDGTPEISIGILADVTESKSVQDRLHRNERRFRALIENALDVIVLLNADGSIRFGSPSGERVLGYSRQELKGRSILDLVHPDDRVLVRGLLDNAQTDHPDAMVEVRLRHRDGSYRTLEGLGRLLVDGDGDVGLVVNARDITARKELEAQLRQAQKMEAIGQLAGGVAHDFNNMLTAIKGFAMLLESDAGDTGDRELYVREIAKAADRAAALTQQLLAFSRRQIMTPSVLDLNHVVREMEGMVQRLVGSSITLALDLPADAAAIVADPTQIEQVILNLVVNARDAMPGGGRLELCTRNHRAAGGSHDPAMPRLKDGDYVVLTVADTGCGVDEATIARMFEPFYTTKEVGRGTGLGLSTVYGIVSQSGGHIGVASTVGRGTHFDIYLPAVTDRAEPHVPAAPARADAASSAGNVLLVDDETSVRLVTRKMLERAGYRVIDVASGDDALERLVDGACACDVLISDVVMPGIGGPELAERLLQTNPHMRVILMSGYADSDALPNDHGAVAYTFLPKPFSPDQLQRTVRAAMLGASSATESAPAPA